MKLKTRVKGFEIRSDSTGRIITRPIEESYFEEPLYKRIFYVNKYAFIALCFNIFSVYISCGENIFLVILNSITIGILVNMITQNIYSEIKNK